MMTDPPLRARSIARATAARSRDVTPQRTDQNFTVTYPFERDVAVIANLRTRRNHQLSKQVPFSRKGRA
jgi:hypothetical protein